MNPPKPSRSHRLWPWLLGLALTPFVVAGLVVASAFRLDADAVALRRQIAAAAGAHWTARVQLSVPPVGVSLARTVVHFIDAVPPQAREALAAVRSASVGVYEWDGTGEVRPGGDLVANADELMVRRGWTRLVGVIDGANTVLIYVPAGRDSAPPSRVCLAVCSGHELVVVAARFNPRALAQLVSREAHAGLLARL